MGRKKKEVVVYSEHNPLMNAVNNVCHGAKDCIDELCSAYGRCTNCEPCPDSKANVNQSAPDQTQG
jgi:hypothetical protein